MYRSLSAQTHDLATYGVFTLPDTETDTETDRNESCMTLLLLRQYKPSLTGMFRR